MLFGFKMYRIHIDYFMVGERVRFLFTTSEQKSYKRTNHEVICLLYLY